MTLDEAIEYARATANAWDDVSGEWSRLSQGDRGRAAGRRRRPFSEYITNDIID